MTSAIAKRFGLDGDSLAELQEIADRLGFDETPVETIDTSEPEWVESFMADLDEMESNDD